MKQELDDALVKDFPNLYQDRNASYSQTCMCWGFPGDGWEPLIRELSAKLEKLILEIPEDKRKSYKAFQVKEKFGTLRFYMCASTKEMEALIDEAESKSETICEGCGAKAETREFGGWLRTTCDACEEKKKNQKVE